MDESANKHWVRFPEINVTDVELEEFTVNRIKS